MKARSSALLALALVAVGCGKKTDVREDPSAKPIPSTSETTVASASASASVAPTEAKAKVVKMIEVGTEIKGLLAPELIKRIIRANFPLFRACYQQGLKKDPDLRGTIAVKFVIDATGAVDSVKGTGGSLKDEQVSKCVLDVYRVLTFPAPEKGVVTVTYPIDFQYDEGSPSDGLQGTGTGTGMGYGGCPCGCDHSQGMVAELRGLPREEALRAIDDSLHTIGEREDAGYITDRMVRHRLRLLGLGKDLGRVGPARFTIIPGVRADFAGSTSSTNVRAQFVFHGQTTELVNGKEKLLLAAFVLRLDLENGGGADVTLHAPTFESKTALPVSRWYVAGGEGQPWDGVLRAGTKKIVHVIGYAGDPIEPGAEVSAAIHFESLQWNVKTRARKHWNQADGQ
jgi:hypothetical protein